MRELKTSESCKYLLQYHFIFVCKYRKRILNPIRNSILGIMNSISKKYDFEIHTQEVDHDHIHLHVESVPKISPSQICRVLKQESTIMIRKIHEKYLSRFFWKEHTLWSDGYFVFSIGNVSEETLKRYIETQGR